MRNRKACKESGQRWLYVKVSLRAVAHTKLQIVNFNQDGDTQDIVRVMETKQLGGLSSGTWEGSPQFSSIDP